MEPHQYAQSRADRRAAAFRLALCVVGGLTAATALADSVASDPPLTPIERYQRATEIYRSLREPDEAARTAAPETQDPDSATQMRCATLARQKRDLESVMRAGYPPSASARLHARMHRIVQQRQHLHCRVP